MQRRAQRIQRLIELRERQLQVQLGGLKHAVWTEQSASDYERQCRQQVLAAEQQRREFAGQPASAQTYLDLENWLESVGIRHARAVAQLQRARLETQRSRALVNQARVSLRQVEMLKRRIEQREQLRRRRQERRAEDELLQVISGRRLAEQKNKKEP